MACNRRYCLTGRTASDDSSVRPNVKSEQTNGVSSALYGSNYGTQGKVSLGGSDLGMRRMTTNGDQCKFPFKYGDKWYYDCTWDGGGGSTGWCATTTTSTGGYQNWGYCKPASDPTTTQAPDGIRLVDGATGQQGRLEVQKDGKWGTVCDDRFSATDAAVVCKQLGYAGRAESYTHGGGTGPILMDEVNCGGTESTIQSCRHTVSHDCGHYEDVGVKCGVVDAVVSDWNDGTCSKSCGGGQMTQTRRVVTSAQHGGATPDLEQTVACNTQACPTTTTTPAPTTTAAPDFFFSFTAVTDSHKHAGTSSVGVAFKQASGIWTDLMPFIGGGYVKPNEVVTKDYATVGRPTMVRFENTTVNQSDAWVLNALSMEVDGQTTEIVKPTWRRWWVKTEQPEFPIPAA